MKLISINKITIIVSTIIAIMIQLIVIENSEAFPNRHAIIYGGFPNNAIPAIANAYDVLIVGETEANQVRALKNLNPNIKVLKYKHYTGMQTSYDGWSYVNGKENWFVHDVATSKRLTRVPYGWYLMNIADASWRTYKVNKIISEIDPAFDGIFIDDMWEKYADKFLCAGTSTSGTADEAFIDSWEDNIIAFLDEMKSKYNGLVYINGTYDKYAPHVDGIVEESFVHSIWNSDSFFHDPDEYERELLKIERLNSLGKPVVAQSGTLADGTGDPDEIFRYCYASYLLIANASITTYFKEGYNYAFQGVQNRSEFAVDLGEPTGRYFIAQEGDPTANMVSNGGFESGMSNWSVISGSPKVDSTVGRTGGSIMLVGTGSVSDLAATDYIPVSGSSVYVLRAHCKSESNNPGAEYYQKLGVKLRYFNSSKQQVGSTDGGLIFDEGSYNWMPYQNSYELPEKTAYVRIFVGFMGTGTGKGWVDDVYFGPEQGKERLFRRNFEKGVVLVNSGVQQGRIKIDGYLGDNGDSYYTLNPHQGRIILKDLPLPAPFNLRMTIAQ